MKAVLSGIDTHPAHSIILMLESVGYECVMLSDDAIDKLRTRGYVGGVKRGELDSMGYSEVQVPFVGVDALETCDLFVDLKTAHLDSFKLLYPDKKVLHFLINGGRDDYENCGFNYPVVTANMWVEGDAFKTWLPFKNVHNLIPRGKRTDFEAPIGLLHNAKNWGFGHMLERTIERTGVRIFGAGSPMGVMKNQNLAQIFEKTLCLLHIKSNDCPGYALYEAFEAGVPIVNCEQMLDRMRMRDLYIDGETCLLWGGDFYDKKYCQETGMTKEWFKDDPEGVIDSMMVALEKLKDPEYNYKIGMAGHEQFKKLTKWTDEKRKAFGIFLIKHGISATI